METKQGQDFFDGLMAAKERTEKDPDARQEAVYQHLKAVMDQTRTAVECIKAGNAVEAGTRRRYALSSLREAERLLQLPFPLEVEKGLA